MTVFMNLVSVLLDYSRPFSGPFLRPSLASSPQSLQYFRSPSIPLHRSFRCIYPPVDSHSPVDCRCYPDARPASREWMHLFPCRLSFPCIDATAMPHASLTITKQCQYIVLHAILVPTEAISLNGVSCPPTRIRHHIMLSLGFWHPV